MGLSSKESQQKLLKSIKNIKQLEESRDEKDKELFDKLITGELTKSDYKKELDKFDKKNIINLDKQILSEFINLTNNFYTLAKELNYSNPEKYYLQKRGFINKLFSRKQTPIKVKKITTPKQIHKDIPPVSKKVETKKHKKLFDFDLSFITKLFSNKKVKKQKSIDTKVVKPEIIQPAFKVPKEIAPENYQVLIPGFAYSFIQEKDQNTNIYVVAEPELTSEEQKILDKTKKDLINKISLTDLKDDSKMYKLINKIFERNKIEIGKKSRDKIVYYILRQVNGLDRIEAIMHDPLIEDIECDGTGIPVFIVHRKYGHIETSIKFETEKELQGFITKMAHLSKSYVSFASPLLDAILPDGSRVNATLTANISTRGPTFTIRKFPQKPLTAIDLINNNTINPEITAYLWTVIEFKKNVLLIGPTAAGKTTLMNVISSFIPPAQRVVSIEDTREINLLMDNWIPQVTRPGFGPPDNTGKKYGEINMVDLLKESFRQRPDYLIIGEVRGEEISLMFQGMASGHCSISTVHSKSVESLTTRLTTPPISLEPSLLASLDVVIVAGFSGSKETKRQIKEIDEIKNFNSQTNKIEYNYIYKSSEAEKEKDKDLISDDLFTKKLPMIYKSDLLKEISNEHNIEPNKLLEVINSRTQFLIDLSKNAPRDYVEFKQALNNYKGKENFLKD